MIETEKESTCYHKINSIYKRDATKKKHPIMEGVFASSEIEYLQHNEWVFTEKVDGTNIRVMWNGLRVAFGGRTDKAQLPIPLLEELQRLFADEAKMAEQFDDGTWPVILYGEGYGSSIQKGGGNYDDAQKFVLFDVRIGDWWLKRKDVQDVGDNLGLFTVPVIGTGTIQDMVNQCKEGFRSRWGDFIAEGIVARPMVELRTRAGHRIITKCKYKDFN